MKEAKKITDLTLIGNWEELNGVEAATISPDLGTERLDGMLIKGYEMKWNATNENGERYDEKAFDDFINDYFVAKGLNMPVDINHEGCYNWKAYCGRVLYIERNSVGFYFVIYIPRTYADYDAIKWAVSNGIVQGFSKEGYATDWEYKYKADGTFDYELIKQIKLLSVSLVSTPANGVPFEKLQEVRNRLQYKVVEDKEDNVEGSPLSAMFNK